MKKIYNQKGFTLIELLLVISLIGIITPLAGNMFVQSFDIFNSGVERMNRSQRMELAVSEISNYLKSATTSPDNNRIDAVGDEITFESKKSGENESVELKGVSSNSGTGVSIELSYGGNRNRVILNDVKSLEIEELEDKGFELYIEDDNGAKSNKIFAKNL